MIIRADWLQDSPYISRHTCCSTSRLTASSSSGARSEQARAGWSIAVLLVGNPSLHGFVQHLSPHYSMLATLKAQFQLLNETIHFSGPTVDLAVRHPEIRGHLPVQLLRGPWHFGRRAIRYRAKEGVQLTFSCLLFSADNLSTQATVAVS